jgi:hypothetical protein
MSYHKRESVVSTPTGDCYCDEIYDECVHCKKSREDRESRLTCSRWSWNYTPRECAKEACELGWDQQKLRSAMTKFGFNSMVISDVMFEFESLDR